MFIKKKILNGINPKSTAAVNKTSEKIIEEGNEINMQQKNSGNLMILEDCIEEIREGKEINPQHTQQRIERINDDLMILENCIDNMEIELQNQVTNESQDYYQQLPPLNDQIFNTDSNLLNFTHSNIFYSDSQFTFLNGKISEDRIAEEPSFTISEISYKKI